MSYWDSKNMQVVRFDPRPYGKRGWLKLDCGCCNGIQWGGEEPVECSDCDGCGFLALHKRTKLLCKFPGGRILGREVPTTTQPK